MVNDCIHVAVALIEAADGRVLVARRHAQTDQGGLWEFPGGKVEPGETVTAALARELQEELGITPVSASPLIRLRHRYPTREVLLDVWRVSRYLGVPYGREGQPLRWLLPGELVPAEFPAANAAIIHAACLPTQYLITPEPDTGFIARLELALQRGVRLVQFRAPNDSPEAVRPLAEQALALCRRYQARLLINRHIALAEAVGADGVHLSSAQLMDMTVRPALTGRWLAASCHTLAEVERANALGLDFVVISPVMPTASHPGCEVLGWQGFGVLAEQARMPAYALGGLGIEDYAQACQHGAQGVAAIRAFWRA